MRPALDRFVQELSATRRPCTIDHYRLNLLRFLRFLRSRRSEIRSWASLRRDPHIEKWLLSLAQRTPPYARNSRRLIISVVRVFLDHLAEAGGPDAPAKGLISSHDMPPPDRYLPRPLAADADRALREGLRAQGSLQARALLLARSTGLRIGELRRLDLECLTEAVDGRCSLRVPLGKLHAERIVPVDDETARLVETIRNQRGQTPSWRDPETGQSVDLLLCKPNGKRLGDHRLRATLRAVARSVGIQERVHPHRLRHTYATELLRHGMSLPGIMKLLGHRSVTMTLRYLEVTHADLTQAYLSAIGRARDRYAELDVRPETFSAKAPPGGASSRITAAFDELIVRLQAAHLDEVNPGHKKGLQRFLERLRRAYDDLPQLWA